MFEFKQVSSSVDNWKLGAIYGVNQADMWRGAAEVDMSMRHSLNFAMIDVVFTYSGM